MRIFSGLILTLGLGLAAAGCGPDTEYEGPKVDAFVGRLTHNGKPVAFPAGEKVTLQLMHHGKGESFGIPIQPDGSFTIGWMPIGKYSAVLKREGTSTKGGPRIYNVPGGLTIEEGKTEYAIELGKTWKP